eukprot:CFRG8082T1
MIKLQLVGICMIPWFDWLHAPRYNEKKNSTLKPFVTERSADIFSQHSGTRFLKISLCDTHSEKTERTERAGKAVHPRTSTSTGAVDWRFQSIQFAYSQYKNYLVLQAGV